MQNDKPNKPEQPKFDMSGLEDSLKDIRGKAQEAINQQPPEVQEKIEKGKGFIERNQKTIVVGIVVVVGLKVYKKKIAKATTKQILKTLAKAGETAPNGTTYPTMLEILRDLRATPQMAYVDHTGQLLHLLRDHNTIVTIAGDFKNMSNEDIWNHVTKVLSGTSFNLKKIA